MDVVSRAIAYLERTPRQFYCDGCLAETLRITRGAARDAAIALAGRRDYRRGIDRCDGCGRVTVAVGFVPAVKCGRCSWPIDDNDAFVAEHDELFHHHCWTILEANARIADSRQIARSSRELIRRSLTRVHVPPLAKNGDT